MSFIKDIELGIPSYSVTINLQLKFIENTNKFVKYFISDSNKLVIKDKIYCKKKNVVIYPKEYYNIIKLPYKDRMEIYKNESITLVTTTLDKLFKRIDKNKITNIITISCTGAFSPSLYDIIANRYKIDCNRYGLNFMGCHAGIKGLNMANDLASKDGVVLLVCCELTSIHTSKIKNKLDMISNLLFGDGCSATIISNRDVLIDKNLTSINNKSKYINYTPEMPSIIKSFGMYNIHILKTLTYSVPNTEKYLTWEMGDKSYKMFIDKKICDAVSLNIENALEKLLGNYNINDYGFVIHPGGRKILDVICKTLKFNNNELQSSYYILENCSNMSSCTIFYVLDHFLKISNKKLIVMIAFGPGMTFEMTLLKNVALNHDYKQRNINLNNPIVMDKIPDRSIKKEIMDIPIKNTNKYTLDDYYKSLDSFNKLYKYLLKNKSFYKNIGNGSINSILEIGCGGGIIAYNLSCKYPNTKIIATDRNKYSIDYCNRKFSNKNLEYVVENDEILSKNYDIIYLCNVCHHMTDNEFVLFIKKIYNICNKKIIILDLDRNRFSSLLWHIPSNILCNKLTKLDGFTSIKKAFTKKELNELLDKAKINNNNIKIERLFPLRWIITIQKEDKNTKSTKINEIDLDNYLNNNKKVEYNKLLFNEIYTSYDKATKAMSLFQDVKWKKLLVKNLNCKKNDVILDLASGTGDLVKILNDEYNNLDIKLIGTDISENMINIAREKCPNNIFYIMDCSKLEFDDNYVNHITASYAFRNFPNWKNSLNECVRVLKSGGTLNIIDFFKPSNKSAELRLFKIIWYGLLYNWTSFMGLYYHRNIKYYNYIYYSIKRFVTIDTFITNLKELGFRDIKTNKFYYGGLYHIQAILK